MIQKEGHPPMVAKTAEKFHKNVSRRQMSFCLRVLILVLLKRNRCSFGVSDNSTICLFVLQVSP
jgi:hypothetical protein